MRSWLFLILLISQIPACDLHYLDTVDSPSNKSDGTSSCKPTENTLPSLDGGVKLPDMSKDPSALQFAFSESSLKRFDCPSFKLSANEVSITDIVKSDFRNCYKNFELALDDQFGKPAIIEGGSSLELDIEYHANKYSIMNPNLDIFENIRFRIYNHDESNPSKNDIEPMEDRILGVLPGFTTTTNSNTAHLIILLRIPLTQKTHSGLVVEFESKIYSLKGDTPIPSTIMGHPASLKINSIRKLTP